MESGENVGARWLIAAMGTILMLCLGTVYASSFFQGLLVREFKDVFGWSNSQVAWIFSLAIFFLGVTAAWGRSQLARRNPRSMAMTGAGLFAAGYAVAALAFSIKSLLLLYAGYGVIGRIGLGALFMSKLLAPLFLGLTGRNLVSVFLILSGGCHRAGGLRMKAAEASPRPGALVPRMPKCPSAGPSPAGSSSSGRCSSATSRQGLPLSASNLPCSRTCGRG